MREPDFLLFASDATLVGIAGAVMVLFSVAAWMGERRRRQRRAIDQVGWMPWTTLSVLAVFGGVVLLAIAAGGWLGS